MRGGHSPTQTRAAEPVPSTSPNAIRPVARLPDWAFTAAAQAAAAAQTAAAAMAAQGPAGHQPVPCLWKAPSGISTAPRGAVSGPGVQLRCATPPQSDWATLPALAPDQRHHHPTVMLFGTNLRLVAAKSPSPPVPAADAAGEAQVSALQSLEQKIKELNEVPRPL